MPLLIVLLLLLVVRRVVLGAPVVAPRPVFWRGLVLWLCWGTIKYPLPAVGEKETNKNEGTELRP